VSGSMSENLKMEKTFAENHAWTLVSMHEDEIINK